MTEHIFGGLGDLSTLICGRCGATIKASRRMLSDIDATIFKTCESALEEEDRQNTARRAAAEAEARLRKEKDDAFLSHHPLGYYWVRWVGGNLKTFVAELTTSGWVYSDDFPNSFDALEIVSGPIPRPEGEEDA